MAPEEKARLAADFAEAAKIMLIAGAPKAPEIAVTVTERIITPEPIATFFKT